MNQVAVDIWPILLPTILSAIALYFGYINRMRTQISVLEEKVRNLEEECENATKKMGELNHSNAVLEEKVKRTEQRQDNHSKKNDDIIQLITEFKLEMTEKIGHMSENMVKIQGDVEVINSTIAVFDSGVVSKKRKKK